MPLPLVALLLDDHDPFVEFLVNEISSNGFKPLIVHSYDELLPLLDRGEFACVILELGVASLEGLRVLEEILRKGIPLASIAVLDNSDIAAVVEAARHGTVTFLLRESTGRQQIQSALNIATAQTTQLQSNAQKKADLKTRFAKLTNGEQQVLERLVHGQKLTTIAKVLDVSRRTVELRRARLMQKLDVATFPDLVALAIEYERDFQSISGT